MAERFRIMELISFRESAYIRKHLNQVKHMTLDPRGPGVVRVHMIPPKPSLDKKIPSVIIINGQDILPINLSWAILLSAFIDCMQEYENKEIQDSELEIIVSNTIKEVQNIYPKVSEQTLKDDLWRIINTLTDIALGKKPDEDIGLISIGEYSKNMTAPHRMDLMISSMCKDGSWNCNQRCLHCYAAGQEMAGVKELPTEAWKEIIQKCRKAGIPQLTFTGGEPTLRKDLVELVDFSKWFITRLNTNGVNLTKELCDQLYNASLDSMQVTLYSADPAKHNKLVGADNWEKTIEGIRNAVSANINVSINTPLCSINNDYVKTLKLANEMGVKYVSCSGLILTGNAKNEKSTDTQISEAELYEILKSAFTYCTENHMEISFTSPGWVSEESLRNIGFTSIPTCGACLSNMAVSPDGSVVPCQSWLSEGSLGNFLTDSWNKIWNSRRCKEIRKVSSKMEKKCQLRTKAKEAK